MSNAEHVIRAIKEQAERQLARAEDFNDTDIAAFACILSDLVDLDEYLNDTKCQQCGADISEYSGWILCVVCDPSIDMDK